MSRKRCVYFPRVDRRAERSTRGIIDSVKVCVIMRAISPGIEISPGRLVSRR